MDINITKAIENNIDRSKWIKWKFSDLVENIVEKVVPKDSGLDHYIGLKHLDTGSLKIRRYGETESLIGNKLKIYKGDLIFAKRNSYLKRVAIADFDAVASAHSLVLRPKPENVDPAFLPFFMMSEKFWQRAIEISVGSLSPTINWKAIAKQEFLLPPKDQQAHLAELLWAMDEVVEREREVLESLKFLIFSFREKSLMHKKYNRIKLDKILNDITAGKSVNGTNNPANANQKGVLKVSAVGPHGFAPLENKVLNTQSDFLDRFAVRKNDILITRANTTELVGRVCLVNNDFPDLMLCDKTLRLEVKNDFNRRLMVEILNSLEARRQIESFATGTGGAMKNITQQEIRSIKIPLIPEENQKKLGVKIKLLYQTKTKVSEVIMINKALQKSLINQIF